MKSTPEAEEVLVKEIGSLDAEVKRFAEELPYWGKFLAAKILSGTKITDAEIETSYNYLLEELKLNEETAKPELLIGSGLNNSEDYKLDLLFTKLESVEGVNALSENQIIEFSPNLTIIYGSNGAGKSGYVRLLKKAFYSKAPEEIIPNIHVATGHKSLNAKFTFTSSEGEVSLNYPKNSTNAEFQQYAVFDGKSVVKHLEQKNEFEFRPAGLGFFGEFSERIKAVEGKLNAAIQAKQTANDFIDLFEGESEIKNLIENLSDKTNIDDLKKYIPFSEEDRAQKLEVEKQHDELSLAFKGKEKEIKVLETIKQLLATNKQNIETLNKHFSEASLKKLKTYIADCVSKEATAKAEGVESFKTDKINHIGTPEWKNFIVAAEKFATNQKTEAAYPEKGDSCLLCQQPLSDDAQQLISGYWTYIKSVAEQKAKDAAIELSTAKLSFEKLIFDLFPADNTLTAWLLEKNPKFLSSLQESLVSQKKLATTIIADISAKVINNHSEIKISVVGHTTVSDAIDGSINLLKSGKQSEEIARLLKVKTKLLHKEKLGLHFAKIEAFVKNQVWIKNARKASVGTRRITETEKSLSEKYFNQRYVEVFNQECIALNGNFGINISHTGSGGKSFRQLKLKGNNPNIILSEGEQKVIALADFIAEMQLSEINRGVIFDDPVTSLDDKRKNIIAERLIKEAAQKQVVIFTHDLVFVSKLISTCEDTKSVYQCHWIECRDDKPGYVFLGNSPAHENKYRNSDPVKKVHSEAKKAECPPQERENLLRAGFTALRTCYEVLVIRDLFKDVVKRYDERVSVDSLKGVYFDDEVVRELLDSFGQCCRYMEGHTHSDKYAYIKPEPDNLHQEILQYLLCHRILLLRYFQMLFEFLLLVSHQFLFHLGDF